MFKYKRIGAILIFLITVYCIWIAVRPTKIVRVDNGAVFVEHLPMTMDGKLNWWLKTKNHFRKNITLSLLQITSQLLL